LEGKMLVLEARKYLKKYNRKQRRIAGLVYQIEGLRRILETSHFNQEVADEIIRLEEYLANLLGE